MVFAFNIGIPTPDRSFIATKTVYGNAVDAIKKKIQGYKYKYKYGLVRQIQMWFGQTNRKVGREDCSNISIRDCGSPSSHAIYPPACLIIHSCTQPICNKYKIQSLEIQIAHTNSQNTVSL